METKPLSKNLLKTLPQTAGVYLFMNDQRQPLYIGKSKNLKARVGSYFLVNLAPKTKAMIKATKYLAHIEVTSEFEALLLEANLVKKWKPKYNLQLKDGKSPLYIVFTKEEFPRILTLRQTDLKKFKAKHVFGPYPTGVNAKTLLKKIRKIFPFSQHKLAQKTCLYSQLGLCHPCPNMIMNETSKTKRANLRKDYLKNINSVTKILAGKLKILQKELDKELKKYSREENFEKAKETFEKLTLFKNLLERPLSPGYFLQNPNLAEETRKQKLKSLSLLLAKYYPIKKLNVIECYDVSHLSGMNQTASLITFTAGLPDKSRYKHFRLHEKKINDPAALKEVVQRRFKHLADWGTPDLVIVDGGKPQVATFAPMTTFVPVIGFAKGSQKIIIKANDTFYVLNPDEESLTLVKSMIDEAHRFTRRYHHYLVSKSISGR